MSDLVAGVDHASEALPCPNIVFLVSQPNDWKRYFRVETDDVKLILDQMFLLTHFSVAVVHIYIYIYIHM